MTINWSAINNRSVLGRVLRLFLRVLPKDMVRPIRVGPAQGMKWIIGSGNHGCWFGSYELDKQCTLEHFVKTGMVIYDIGAQAGFYTLFFSRLVENGRVYAFEPFAENLHHLISHIRMNNVQNVQVIQVALAERSGLSGFIVDRGKYQNTLTDAVGARVLVPTLSLDEALEMHGLAPPDIIKMDVEGAEAAVLEGARRTLECYRPIVFVALHGEGQKRACWALLEAMGYRLFGLDEVRLVGHLETDEVYAMPAMAQ